MRVLISILVILATAAVSVWIFVQRRKNANTPSLDTVTALLDKGAKRGDTEVTGTLSGFSIEFVNKQYRQSMWTELTVGAPGAKILLEMKAANLGDVPAFVRGAPVEAANAMVAELRDEIAKLHPKTIEIDDQRVKLVADRVVRDDADARAFVQLGLDLATRSTGGTAIKVPAGVANAQREQMREEQSADRGKRVIAALLVLLVIGGGLGVFAYKMLQKRKAHAAQQQQ